MFANYRLERKLDRLERKLDLIIRHLGIADPSTAFDYSAVDEFLSRGKKIHAIKAYRELDPLADLKEAKDAVEARERAR
ncbi:hypothetical protein OHB26_01350 [Nocardia sp. NBC_01503]|uniref:hypothetical protein n=1 Tax=Nocardia sp. NBC_01503 TaxID=2975997 RepID=UPI002E7BD44A|nr:hypothetical protein [Nocardia sp. NBC_01503]WTL32934.1 hypothetical protein OHB26_01350 [Nocardia sp. NBC_01503]